jgi:hypothetical protein
MTGQARKPAGRAGRFNAVINAVGQHWPDFTPGDVKSNEQTPPERGFSESG